MRLVKVDVPQGFADKVLGTAFACGIDDGSVQSARKVSSSGKSEERETVNFEVSTPTAKRLLAAILKADYFDPDSMTANVRQPRSLINRDGLSSLTNPVGLPAPDVYEDLWQFSHITYALVLRVFGAGCVLAYGLINSSLLMMIAGLMFLPTLSIVMGVSLGLCTGDLKLALRSAAAFLVCIVLVLVAAACVAAISQPPLKFSDFPSPLASAVISAIVGCAAALGTIDDIGRRELIGLAAAAQIGVIPAWLGVCLVFGPPSTSPAGDMAMKALMLAVNVVCIAIASAVVFLLTRTAGPPLLQLKQKGPA